MEIIRNDDGTLEVPVEPARHPTEDSDGDGGEVTESVEPAEPTTKILHPGEGGYDEALAEWDAQQNPDRGPAVSTASGRDRAMSLVHAVGQSSDDDISAHVTDLDDPESVAEALRHVLVGGAPSVEDFASEAAEAEGGEPLPAHEATTIIGKILAQLD